MIRLRPLLVPFLLAFAATAAFAQGYASKAVKIIVPFAPGGNEFCGCFPAYLGPAVPSGLNAEPGAEVALPGVLGAVALPQL